MTYARWASNGGEPHLRTAPHLQKKIHACWASNGGETPPAHRAVSAKKRTTQLNIPKSNSDSALKMPRAHVRKATHAASLRAWKIKAQRIFLISSSFLYAAALAAALLLALPLYGNLIDFPSKKSPGRTKN